MRIGGGREGELEEWFKKTLQILHLKVSSEVSEFGMMRDADVSVS